MALQEKPWPKPWPESSEFYDAATINARAIRRLLDKDAEYVESPAQSSFRCLWQEQQGPLQMDDPRENPNPLDRLESHRATSHGDSSFSAIFIRQKRFYAPDRTYCKFEIDKQLWKDVLVSVRVHPSFLEILHNNNSAHVSRTTYDADSKQPNAMHLMLKVGRWQEIDFALYARQDLVRGRAFILFAGTQSLNFADALPRRSKGCTLLNIFNVVLMILEQVYSTLEVKRWAFDTRTQKMEERAGFTGYGGLRQQTTAKYELDHVDFTKELHRLAHSIRSLLWASARFADMVEFLLGQMDLYRDMARLDGNNEEDVGHERLKSAFQHRLEILRGQRLSAERLLRRLDAQMDVTRALIADRDMRVTIDIGVATRRDSEVMRNIATVTMIFLPATFVATFFSMAFFQSPGAGGELSVGRQIWMYPTITVPLTLIIGALFFLPAPSFKRLVGLTGSVLDWAREAHQRKEPSGSIENTISSVADMFRAPRRRGKEMADMA